MSRAFAFVSNSGPQISGLSIVQNPVELRNLLDPVLPSTWGELRELQVKVLRHKAGKRRYTMEIMLQTTTGEHELIGKVYEEDRSDIYLTMKQISESGFGPEAEFSIPQPYAFIPGLKLLLMEKVHGPLAKEIFLTGNGTEQIEAAERCALWLARFHSQAPMLGSVFVPTDYLAGYCPRLAEPVGSLADKAQLLHKRLEIAAAALDRSEVCACHGAFCHHQISLTETRTTIFDWDNYRVAEPAWDLARFLISLQKLALRKLNSLNALDAVGEAFFKSYTAASRFEVARHLPFYKAAQCLKRANSSFEPMLDEGLRILAEET
jgi:hypothetical protein